MPLPTPVPTPVPTAQAPTRTRTLLPSVLPTQLPTQLPTPLPTALARSISPTVAPLEGALRLVGGGFQDDDYFRFFASVGLDDDSLDGRLEIYHDGIWGTVCAEGFDEVDAAVACAQLGGVSATVEFYGRCSDYPNAPLDLHESTIWMSNVTCVGDETWLADCDFAGYDREFSPRCQNKDNVCLSCDVGPVIFDDVTIRVAVGIWRTGSGAGNATYGPIGSWDVSQVTDMSYLFAGDTFFDEDLSRWDVRSLRNADATFAFCEHFRSDLSGWDTRSLEIARALFVGAKAFNSDLSAWDVSQVTVFDFMFSDASDFNQSLGWNLTCGSSQTSLFHETACEATDCGSTLCPAFSYCAYAELASNGRCDPAANTAACSWDGGDCCEETCSSEGSEFPCGSVGYNCLSEPLYDDDDEHPGQFLNLTECPDPYGYGDGRCDAALNVPECAWDGGDCCEETCSSEGSEFPCGSVGYNCLSEPLYDDDDEHPGQFLNLTECPDPYGYGDGRCDAALNVPECAWDGGDCCNATCTGSVYPCGTAASYDCRSGADSCNHVNWTKAGDGRCDPELNFEGCNWDNGDCCELTCNRGNARYECGAEGYDCQACPASVTGLVNVGDGRCDAALNTRGCSFDLGDCCATTCSPLGQYACGSQGYDCIEEITLTWDGTNETGIDCADVATVANGYCDVGNNKATCFWDGGDCCEETCFPLALNPCGSSGGYANCDPVSLKDAHDDDDDEDGPPQRDLCLLDDLYCGAGATELGLYASAASCGRDLEKRAPSCAQNIQALAYNFGTGQCQCCDGGVTLLPAAPGAQWKLINVGGCNVTVGALNTTTNNATNYTDDGGGGLGKNSTCEDLVEPATPRLVAGKFSSTGAAVDLTFDAATDGAGLAGAAPCDALLVFSNAAEATCSWKSPRVLTATLTAAHGALIPGSNVASAPNAIRAECPVFAADCTCWTPVSTRVVTLEAPDVPVSVGVNIEAPAIVGSCDDLLLSAASTTGSAGRPLAFDWNVYVVARNDRTQDDDNDDDATPEECTTILVRPELVVVAGSRAVLAEATVAACAGHTLRFSVTATNFFGARDEASALVKIVAEALPSVQFAGGSATLTMTASQALYLRVDAGFKACDGAVTSASADAALVYVWRVRRYRSDGSEYAVAPKTVRADPRLYVLNARTLTKGDRLTATVTVSSTSALGAVVTNNASKTVVVAPSTPVALIGGGDRTVSSTTAFTVDASGSFDPDGTAITFAWSASGKTLAGVTSATVTKAQVDLALGSDAAADDDDDDNRPEAGAIRVRVEVTTADFRTATAAVDITIVEAAVPTVDISLSQGLQTKSSAAAATGTLKINPSQRLRVTARVAFSVGATASGVVRGTWAATTGTFSGGALAAVATTATGYDVPVIPGAASGLYYLVLPAATLTPGSLYTFVFQVGGGRASVTFVANAAPTSGVVACSPAEGTVLETAFLLEASAWADDDLPLAFAFGYRVNEDPSTATVLREYTPSPTYRDILFPLGNVTAVARVADAFGAVARAETGARVRTPADASVAAVTNASTLLFDQAQTAGDSEAVFQVAQAVTSILNDATATNSSSSTTTTTDDDGGDGAVLESKKALRGSVLVIVLETALSMDGTEDASGMQAAVCLSLSKAPRELTDDSALTVVAVLVVATNTTLGIGLPDETRDSMLGALSNLFLVEGPGASLETGTGSILDAVTTSGLLGVVAGEAPKNKCTETFCVESSRAAQASLATAIFVAPVTAGPGASLRVASTNADGTVDVSIVEFARSAGRRNASSFQIASVTRIYFAADADDDARRRRLEESEESSSSSTVLVTLENYEAANYGSGVYDVNSTSTVDCSATDAVVQVKCTHDNSTFALDCGLFDSTAVNPCTSVAACLTYGDDGGWADTGACQMVNFTAKNTTCACKVDDGAPRSFEVVSSSELVVNEFAQAFTINPLDDLGSTLIVLLTLVALAVVIAAAGLWGYHRDQHQVVVAKREAGMKNKKEGGGASSSSPPPPGAVAVVGSSSLPPPLTVVTTVRAGGGDEKAVAVAALNESLPPWVKQENLWETFWDLLYAEHSIMGYVMSFDAVRSRPLRAVHMFCEYAWLFASEAALFIVAFPDIGCEKYEIRSECLKPTNPYFPTVDACKWDPGTDPVCQANADGGATVATTVILLMILSAILVPMSIFIDKVVDVLAAPIETAEEAADRKAKATKVQPEGGQGAKQVADKEQQQHHQGGDDVEAKRSSRVLEALIADRGGDFKTRVEAAAELAMTALRLRHEELLEAAAAAPGGAAGASSRALVKFEKAHGFRRKHGCTWRAAFFARESDADRFERKVRRRVRRNLMRADLWDMELAALGTAELRSAKLLEFSRIDRLAEVEQRIYLRRATTGEPGKPVVIDADGDGDEEVVYVPDELPPVSRAGNALAGLVFAFVLLFPIYYVTVAFSQIAAKSQATSRFWLRSVLIYICCDLLVYQPARISFFGIYLPGLIKTKLRGLGNPTMTKHDDDLGFDFKTPLFEGASMYLAARHRDLSVAPLILGGLRRRNSNSGPASLPSKRRLSLSKKLWTSASNGGSTPGATQVSPPPSPPPPNDKARPSPSTDGPPTSAPEDTTTAAPNNNNKPGAKTTAPAALPAPILRTSSAVIIWSAILLLPNFIQDIVVDEGIIATTGFIALGIQGGLSVAFRHFTGIVARYPLVTEDMATAAGVIVLLLAFALIVCLIYCCAVLCAGEEFKILADHLHDDWDQLKHTIVEHSPRLLDHSPRVVPTDENAVAKSKDDDDDDIPSGTAPRTENPPTDAIITDVDSMDDDDDTKSATPWGENQAVRPGPSTSSGPEMAPEGAAATEEKRAEVPPPRGHVAEESKTV